MRVAAHDRVDVLGEALSQIDDLTGASGLPAAVAEGSRMRDDEDDLGAIATQLLRQAVDDRRGVVEAQPGNVRCPCRRRRLPRRESDDANLHGATLDDGIASNPRHWT